MRAAVLALLVVIPACSMIEADQKPEHVPWPRHCTAAGIFLSPGGTAADTGAEGLRQWWAQRSDGYVLLQGDDCSTVAVDLPKPRTGPGGRVDFTLTLHVGTPGGAALLQKLETPTGARSLWFLPRPGAALQPVENLDDPYTGVVLSASGDALAWLEYREDDGHGPRYRLGVKPLRAGGATPPHTVNLPGREQSQLLAFDSANRQALLWRNDRPVFAALDGSLRDAPYTADLVSPISSTYRIHPRGWIAWDGYRGNEPYRLAWSLSGQSGAVRTNKGRSITSAAVDAAGRFIAMSESSSLRIGNAPDLVRVFRAADATEALRLYLPRSTRSEVAFFAGGRFAYTDAAGTHLLQIAE